MRSGVTGGRGGRRNGLLEGLLVVALALVASSLPAGAAESPDDIDRSVSGLEENACKPYFVDHGFTFGSYGSLLYQNFTTSRDDDTPANEPATASLSELFVYLGYRIDNRWVFNSSFGIQDAVAGDGEPGEATVEFAYVDYSKTQALGARGGLVLLPLGFLNERHEMNSYLGTLRPQTELRIIPTTWREAGGGLYGRVGQVEWRGFLTTGLDAAGFTPDSLAGGRQQGAEALASDLSVSARVDWTPLTGKNTGTLLVGASGITGGTGQDQPGFPEGRLTLWDAHVSYRWHGLWTRALVARSILSDAGEISLAIDPSGNTVIGERMNGWYVELGYDALTLWQGTGQRLIPFCRFESLNTESEVAPGMTADPEADLTVKTCGVAWNPIRQVRLTVDATNFDNQANNAVDQVNMALGWAF